ncbi:4740_t:CDS:2 [Acaulospora colombiana]|uniref:4740_t:CDS:1 n=1 Tax=Acaulospora colombiana TaxID=27376 RepID=A0ACA9M7I1_9GLOM|nr:4740_t:CDS:2 [Acaulospora colombiana]
MNASNPPILGEPTEWRAMGFVFPPVPLEEPLFAPVLLPGPPVKGDRVNASWIRSPSELIQLLRIRDRKNADDGPLYIDDKFFVSELIIIKRHVWENRNTLSLAVANNVPSEFIAT